MQKHAIEQALERLKKAGTAHASLLRASTHQQTESAWSDFLLAASTVYSKLQKGSMGYGRSVAWFGRMKHERKSDPLLSYIHHARNADEHGIERVTERHHGSFSVGSGGAIRLDGVIGGQHTNLTITHVGGPPPVVSIIRPHVKLVAVKDDRFGDTFDVPTTHLGIPLKDRSPVEIASLALAYLKKLVADGAQLMQ
jgi:hypothetical protein